MSVAQRTRASIKKQATITTNVHPQMQSPLFGLLPAEVRNEIFALALQEYDDPNQMYPKDSYYYRTGFFGEKRTDLQLLRTCKRAYQETKALPFRNFELRFYAGSKEHTPPGYLLSYPYVYHPKWHKKLSSTQYAKIDTIRLFIELFSFRREVANFILWKRKALLPKTIIFTIRATDLQNWERNDFIDLTFFNPSEFWVPASVTKIIVEFEAREGLEDELEGLVKKMVGEGGSEDFTRMDRRRLGVQREVGGWKWVGPRKFGDGRGFPGDVEGGEMVYSVKVLTWLLLE